MNKISDLTELIGRAQAAERPGVVKAETTNRRRWKKCAISRFEQNVVLKHDGSGRKLGEEIIEADESALRRPGTSLPMPWWLEALIEREPELAAAYVRSILEDIERLRPTGT